MASLTLNYKIKMFCPRLSVYVTNILLLNHFFLFMMLNFVDNIQNHIQFVHKNADFRYVTVAVFSCKGKPCPWR